MSIPRSISQLRFTSIFGVLCSVYLCFAVLFVFFCDKALVPLPSVNLSEMKYGIFKYEAIMNTIPLIIFG